MYTMWSQLTYGQAVWLVAGEFAKAAAPILAVLIALASAVRFGYRRAKAQRAPASQSVDLPRRSFKGGTTWKPVS